MTGFIVGLLIGAILGLTGAGGSVLALPLLIHLLHVMPHSATGISLGAVAASAIFGVISRVSKNEIVWLPGLIFAGSGALFAPLGQKLSHYFSETVIIGGFSFLMVIIGIKMWRQTLQAPEQARMIRASRHDEALPQKVLFDCVEGRYRLNWKKLLSVCGGGFVTGILSGFFGVGGGFIIIPILILITGISMKQAVGTSLFIVSMISTSGFGSYLVFTHEVPWLLLGQVSLGGIGGMLLGTLLGQKLAGPVLQQVFASGVLLMAFFNLFKLLN